MELREYAFKRNLDGENLLNSPIHSTASNYVRTSIYSFAQAPLEKRQNLVLG